jgi:alkylation response protein AidB-like acyl-CoA dehydrogenase
MTALRRWPSAEESELAAEVRRLTEHHCPLDELRGEPAGPVHVMAWKHLAGQLGVAGLAVPEELGGAGADVGALAVVAQELGRAVAAVPFFSTVLAAELLLGLGEHDLLPALAAGELPIACALPWGAAPASVHADGTGLRGTVTVLDGAEAQQLLVAAQTGDGVGIFLVDAADVTRRQLRTVDLGRPQASVTFDGASGRRLGSGDASPAIARARRMSSVLIAAEQCGVAARILSTAVEHAKTRNQFGQAIGSFQAVKHLCAEMFARVELAQALLGAAVTALRSDGPVGDMRVALRSALIGCSQAALAVTGGSVQVLGGIGFTWEHDAHLFYRRARANSVLAGSLTEQVDVLAGLLLEGAGDLSDDAVDPALAEFTEATRRWFAENTGRPVLGRGGDEATEAAHLSHAKAFRRALSEAGLAGITVPTEFGGQGLTVAHEAIVAAAAQGRENFEDVFGIGVGMCVPVLLTLGTQEQKARHIAPLLRGEEIWCQLFSEPEAGSDLAGLRTRAVPTDDGGWVVSGQKVWTTYAQHADFALLLARTDPDAPKHKGITMFLVDMKAPGITVRPLRQITGDSEFNEVFLDDLRLPADAVVGTVNGGWNAAMVMLMNERVTIGRDPLTMSPPADFARLRQLVIDRGLTDDGAARAKLVEVYLLQRSLVLLGRQITATLRPGEDPGPYASISKLGAAQLARLTTEVAFDLAGPDAAAWDPEHPDAGVWAYSVLFAPALGIAGGTDQIQKTIIGERLLGLPKG